MTIATDNDLPTAEFWAFSVTLYGNESVKEQMLRWQDENGANVNLVLLCIWAGTPGRNLSTDDIRRATGKVASWNAAVTRPLRHLRQRLKSDWRQLANDAEPARQAILSAELEAEKAEQELLLKALAPWLAQTAADASTLIKANLAAYLGSAATAAPASSIAAICSGE